MMLLPWWHPPCQQKALEHDPQAGMVKGYMCERSPRMRSHHVFSRALCDSHQVHPVSGLRWTLIYRNRIPNTPQRHAIVDRSPNQLGG